METNQHRKFDDRWIAMSGRRGALVVFAASLLAFTLGLLAWGPVTIATHAHRYADARSWLGVPNTVNVLVNLPIFWLAVWGWCATRLSAWPRALRLPWQGFHLWVMAAALSSATYHAAPSDALLLASRTCQACAFMLLVLGLLAERVDPRFGHGAACCFASIVVVLTGLAIAQAGRHAHGAIDLRPLVLLEALPVLLIPVAMLGVPNVRTRLSGWLIALAVYAVSKLLGLADASIFGATGWISGHTLMHLGCAMVVGWMAYRAMGSRIAAGVGADTSAGALNQRQTSLNTTG